MSSAEPGGRRAALRLRHREAILEAAMRLVAERNGPHFTVEELADAADVARRTVFNHFSSIDGVLLELCNAALGDLVEEFVAGVAQAPAGDGSRAALFDQIARALDATDLPHAVASVTMVLGRPDRGDPRGRAVTTQAFEIAADGLLAEIARRDPGFDEIEARVLVGSVVNAVLIVADEWVAVTGAQVGDESRILWQDLMTRCMRSVRLGYLPAS